MIAVEVSKLPPASPDRNPRSGVTRRQARSGRTPVPAGGPPAEEPEAERKDDPEDNRGRHVDVRA